MYCDHIRYNTYSLSKSISVIDLVYFKAYHIVFTGVSEIVCNVPSWVWKNKFLGLIFQELLAFWRLCRWFIKILRLVIKKNFWWSW